VAIFKINTLGLPWLDPVLKSTAGPRLVLLLGMSSSKVGPSSTDLVYQPQRLVSNLHDNIEASVVGATTEVKTLNLRFRHKKLKILATLHK